MLKWGTCLLPLSVIISIALDLMFAFNNIPRLSNIY